MKTAYTFLRFLTISVFVIILMESTYSQDFNYLPAKVSNHQVISYTQFTLSYNEDHEQSEWISYELTSEEAVMNLDRCDCFRADRKVKTKSASKRDYRSSGFELGQLCPAADNNMSKKANRESFRMSNVSPQLPGFNSGVWRSLEEWVREQAIQYGVVYVVSGPVFNNNLGALGKNNVTIPGYYYKVLLRYEGSKILSIAFLIPHIGSEGNIQDYIVTVNTVESITDLDFFPALDNAIENRIESQFQTKKWGF